jgi:hypothetical protein
MTYLNPQTPGETRRGGNSTSSWQSVTRYLHATYPPSWRGICICISKNMWTFYCIRQAWNGQAYKKDKTIRQTKYRYAQTKYRYAQICRRVGSQQFTYTHRMKDHWVLLPARKFWTSFSATVEVFATHTIEPSKCRLPDPVAMEATQVKRPQHGTCLLWWQTIKLSANRFVAFMLFWRACFKGTAPFFKTTPPPPPPGERSRNPLEKRLGGTQSQSERCDVEKPVLPGIGARSSSPLPWSLYWLTYPRSQLENQFWHLWSCGQRCGSWTLQQWDRGFETQLGTDVRPHFSALCCPV